MKNFKVSPYLLNMILNDSFGNLDDTFTSTKLYVGLGIDTDENESKFTKEPVSEGFTILPNPVVFDEPYKGIIRNKEALEWPKAEVDWTVGTDTINYIGLYYNLLDEESGAESGSESESNSGVTTSYINVGEESESSALYKLVMVLPLAPTETVLLGERMVLNSNSIVINLSNR